MTLFHTLTDSACIQVRKLLMERGMVEQTRFRNIDVSEEARSELKHLLRSDEVKVPVLVANDQVITELSAILSFLNKPV